MMDEHLTQFVTEVEAAQLLSVVKHLGVRGGYDPSNVLRRLLFERDRLQQAVTTEARVARDYRQQRDEWMAKAQQQAAYADVSIEVDDERLRRVRELESAIRKHRDERGDDRCWMDDEELYKVLPEGYTPPERDCYIELINCIQFQRCRRNPATEYISPQRRIEELEAEVARLRNRLPSE